MTAPDDSLKPGVFLDKRYEIKHKIKSGGMGAIYMALDHRFDKIPCAVKVMLIKSSKADEQKYLIERFREEAKLLHNLRHTNLPVVKDYFVEGGLYYLVMDYVEGRDLESVLDDYPQGIPENLVIEWSKQILDALDYLHSQSPPIVYRDVKPANIMLRSSDQKIILVDFGIARRVNQQSQAAMTVVGTPVFAPEELLQGRAGPGTDIYSLGATMHCLLTGVVPKTLFSFKPVREINPRVSVEASSVIMHALARDVNDRYMSAKEMREALEELPAPSSAVTLPPGTTFDKEPACGIPLASSKKTGVKRKSFLRNIIFSMAGLSVCGLIILSLGIVSVLLVWLKFNSLSEAMGNFFYQQKWYRPAGIFYALYLGNKPEDTVVLYNYGNILYFEGNYEEASKYYSKALGRNLLYEEALDKTEKVLDKEQTYKNAILCYKSLDKNSENIDVLYNEGNVLYLQGNYEEAIKYFDRVLAIKSGVAEAWYMKGEALNELKQHEEAIACYKKALDINGKFSLALNGKGDALDDIGKYDEAIDAFDEALKIDPDFIYALSNKGYALDNKGKYEKALEYFDKALDLAPEFWIALNGKGQALNGQGNYQEAIVFYDEALKIKPGYAYAWYDKGVALDNLKKYEDAIVCYDEALKFDSEFAFAWNDKGMALDNLKKYEDAIVCYEKALKIDSNYKYAWNNKGAVLDTLEKYEEAIVCYDKALEIDPEYDAALNGKGVVFHNQGKYKEAIEYYDKAINLAPANVQYKENKADALKALANE